MATASAWGSRRLGGKRDGEEARMRTPIRGGWLGTRREDTEGVEKTFAALLGIPYDDECECDCHESGKPGEVCGECFKMGCLEE